LFFSTETNNMVIEGLCYYKSVIEWQK